MVSSNVASTARHRYDVKPVVTPPEQQADVAALHHFLEQETATNSLRLITPNGKTAIIPESVFGILEQIIEVMASGDAVSVVPMSQPLTTQQASEILAVSPAYLARLLEDGHIPFIELDTERRIQVNELLTYKKKCDQERDKALDELAELSQQYGGYAELQTA